MEQPISRQSDFDREISRMTREIIEGVLPREKLYHYIGKLLCRSAKWFEEGLKDPVIQHRLHLFGDRIKDLIPKSLEFSRIVKEISEGKIKPQDIADSMIPFMISAQEKALETAEIETQVNLINKNQIPLSKLKSSIEELIAYLKSGKTPLMYLDMTDMNLEEAQIQELLKNCSQAKIIIFSKQKVTDAVFASILKMKNLEKLELISCSLTLLPKEIGDLVSLKTLALSKNWLSSLPASIGNLINLKELLIDENQLMHLPKQIGQLKELEILRIRKNKLKEIPEEISNLQNLEILGLSKNELLQLPDTIGDLKKIKTLSLEHNWIRKLPATFKNLSSLETLNLSENNFSYFPEVLIELSGLKELDIKGNSLPYIPSEEMKGVRILE